MTARAAARVMRARYVSTVRGARAVARQTGLLRWLERHSDNRAWLYLRSLFAIYDVRDLARIGIPWWTFSAIDEVERFLATLGRTARVFEYGPGASTLWLARRAGTVYAVEHDRHHFEVMRDLAGADSNVQLIFEPPGPPGPEVTITSTREEGIGLDFSTYVQTIRASGDRFDLIVVDGRARAACVREALRHLAPGGVLLVDDSQRRGYRAALAAVPLPRQTLRGLTPCLPYFNETTLFRNHVGA